MMFWYWLHDNANALQAVAGLFGIALTVVTVCVLVVTWNAIKRQAKAAEEQADAARALTKVARQQTEAAMDAAESAKKQADLLSEQIEQSTAPLLVAELDENPNMQRYRLINRGNGVAFQVSYYRGEAPKNVTSSASGVRGVEPSTLAPGHPVYVPIPVAWLVFTIVYRGIDGAIRWTEVHRDPEKGQNHRRMKGSQIVFMP